jgi:cell wall assembly regulator SMI1
MNEIWHRFESWLNANFKEAFHDLNKPISKEQISLLEKTLSIKLPEEFVYFLKLHNGQAGDSGWIIDGSELLSSERIIDEWTVWNDLLKGGDFDDCMEERDNGVKSDWWNSKWIPFTYDGSGNHLCIDLDPAVNGTYGQIITMWHDDGEREVKAKSFMEWFSQYVQDIENGKYVYSDDYEAIVNANDV